MTQAILIFKLKDIDQQPQDLITESLKSTIPGYPINYTTVRIFADTGFSITIDKFQNEGDTFFDIDLNPTALYTCVTCDRTIQNRSHWMHVRSLVHLHNSKKIET